MKFILLLSYFFCLTTFLKAQPKSKLVHDSTYYVSYVDKLVSRVYLSQRYTNLRVSDKEVASSITYKPNNPLSIGTGATYGWFTFNLAYGLGFIYPNKEGTKLLNLQVHSYSQKNVLDLFAQFYSVKPNFKTQLFGASDQYVFNHKRFSYRAAFLQNEWQKKSSGSFLLGAETYFGKVKGDTTFIPAAIDQTVATDNRMNFFELGPNVGYVYTLVLEQHFFITGSLSFSMDYGKITFENSNGKSSKEGFNPNLFSRISAGYNSEKWALNAIWLNNNIRLADVDKTRKLYLNTGDIRVVYAYRFTPGPRLKKRLRLFYHEP